jgi:hypothetical protein
LNTKEEKVPPTAFAGYQNKNLNANFLKVSNAPAPPKF